MDLWPLVTLVQTGKFMSKEVAIECYQWVPQGKLLTDEQFQYEPMKQKKTWLVLQQLCWLWEVDVTKNRAKKAYIKLQV